MESKQYLDEEGRLSDNAPEIPLEAPLKGCRAMVATRLVDDRMLNPFGSKKLNVVTMPLPIGTKIFLAAGAALRDEA